jgi:hypothetical protein
MKPWQASLNKAPSQGGKEEQRERTQVRARSTTTQSKSNEAKEQFMFQSPHQSQEAHQGREGKLERSNYMASLVYSVVLSLSPTVSPKRQRREKGNKKN